MCDYQCTSVRFIKLSNRIESKNLFVRVNRIELFFPESECSTTGLFVVGKIGVQEQPVVQYGITRHHSYEISV